MEEAVIIPVKFIKVVERRFCRHDKLRLPSTFLAKFKDAMPAFITLVLRNGDEIDVQFKKKKGCLIGMRKLYEKFRVKKGCIIVFQYNGGDNMWTHVINLVSATEIDADLLMDVGCKFIKFFLSENHREYKLLVPKKFVDMFGTVMPKSVNYRLKNGKIIAGTYCNLNKTLSGLEEVFSLTNLKLFEILLFTYCGEGLFDVSVFAVSCMEKNLTFAATASNVFTVKIKKSHLLKYCVGVYISKKFTTLTNQWKNGDYIKVWHGKRSWKLQIKVKKGKITIHQGWKKLCNDINLKCGDECTFESFSSVKEFNMKLVQTID